MDSDNLVLLGRTDGAYGVRGWVRIVPFGQGEALYHAPVWHFQNRAGEARSLAVKDIKVHGGVFLVLFEGFTSKEQADALKGRVFLCRSDMPEPGEGEYYAADLVGCSVVNGAGVSLGKVTEVTDNGVQDILLTEKTGDGKTARHMIPVVPSYVLKIDPAAKTILVDWEEDWG